MKDDHLNKKIRSYFDFYNRPWDVNILRYRVFKSKILQWEYLPYFYATKLCKCSLFRNHRESQQADMKQLYDEIIAQQGYQEPLVPKVVKQLTQAELDESLIVMTIIVIFLWYTSAWYPND